MKMKHLKLCACMCLGSLLAGAETTVLPDPADGFVGPITIDTDANVTINSSKTTQDSGTGGGITGNSSIVKRGTGTLTVNGMHSFTGNIDIYGGTYQVGSGTTDKSEARNSQLGNPRAFRTITVYTNGTLKLARTGVFGAGTSTTDIQADVEIRGGTLSLANGSCTPFGNLLLHNATVEYGNGAGNWPTFCFSGSWLEFAQDDPSKPYVFDTQDDWNTCGFFFSKNTPVDVRVPDITGDSNADVIFNCKFKDIFSNSGAGPRSWACTTNFVKTGTGTLELGSIDSNFSGDVVISNGTLRTRNGKARIGNNLAYSIMGDSRTNHTIYVEPGATFHMQASDTFGQFYSDVKTRIHVRGGTLQQSANKVNAFGPIILEDATLSYSGPGNKWPTFGFSEITFKGHSAYVLPYVEESYFAFGMNGNGPATIEVDDIVSGGSFNGTPDVTIASLIRDCTSTWPYGGVTYGPRATSFRKTGPGVLKLTHGSNDFTGDVEITNGIFALNKRGTIESVTQGSFGNLMVDKTIRVYGSGEVYFPDSDILGQLCADIAATMVVSNGTLRFASGKCNGLPALDLYDPVFIYQNGSSSTGSIRDNAYTWGLWAWRFPVSFNGTHPVELPSKGNYNTISLGYSSDFAEEPMADGLTCYKGRTEIKVADITKDGAVDVVIGQNIQSLPNWSNANSKFKNTRYRCGLLKTGPGTLRLDGEFACPMPTRIKEGALAFNGSLREQGTGWGKSVMRVENGAFLGGSGTVDAVVVEPGGGFTSVPGQTTALTTGTVTLPDDKVVYINLAYAGDLENVTKLTFPAVKAANLADAKFVARWNGAEVAPPNFRMSVEVVDGVVRGVLSRAGLVIIAR